MGYNVETVNPCKGLTLTIWDIGGQDKIRELWKHYYNTTEGTSDPFINLIKLFTIFVISLYLKRFTYTQCQLTWLRSNPTTGRLTLIIVFNPNLLNNPSKPVSFK